MWKNQNAKNGVSFMKSISKDEKVMINEYDAASKLLNLGDKKVADHYKSYR